MHSLYGRLVVARRLDLCVRLHSAACFRLRGRLRKSDGRPDSRRVRCMWCGILLLCRGRVIVRAVSRGEVRLHDGSFVCSVLGQLHSSTSLRLCCGLHLPLKRNFVRNRLFLPWGVARACDAVLSRHSLHDCGFKRAATVLLEREHASGEWNIGVGRRAGCGGDV